MKQKEAVAIVSHLMCVLPDTIRIEPCWGWAWDELGADAQEEVKAVRKRAHAWLMKNARYRPTLLGKIASLIKHTPR